MASDKAYNPLEKKRLAQNVADAVLGEKIVPMSELKPFEGAGVYVIYYTGDFPEYGPISEANKKNKFKAPVYVGKAVPEGTRKGGFGLGDDSGPVLYKRLAKHSETIRAAKNLNLSDFYARYLVVDDIWIPLAESMLIEMFSPIWNKLIDGFGNNDPGKGRYQQQRSAWDTLHPGREWAEKCQSNPKTQNDLRGEVKTYHQKKNI